MGVIGGLQVQRSHESHQFRDDGDEAKGANLHFYLLGPPCSPVRIDTVYLRLGK